MARDAPLGESGGKIARLRQQDGAQTPLGKSSQLDFEGRRIRRKCPHGITLKDAMHKDILCGGCVKKKYTV